MIGYTSTPTNFYEDYICHYGIKGMKWGKRKKKVKTPTIYKYKPARSMTEFESAFYNDPRYKRHTDAMKGDWRMGKAPQTNTGLKGDPRYERHFDTMNNDPRFHNSDPTTTWNLFSQKAKTANKFNYLMPGSVAAKERTESMQKAYREYQTAKSNHKKKKRWR